MEWLLQKALESASKSYSPEKVAEMLDRHQEAIELLTKVSQYTIIVLLIFIGVVAIRAEFRYHKLEQKIKFLEKNRK